MNKQVIYSKVNGTTFNGRQDVIAEMVNGQKCVLIPDPQNEYDKNAIGVWCCEMENADWKRELIGYIPKDRAAEIVSKIPTEGLACVVDEITGGFATYAGEKAFYGVILRIEI